VTAEYLSILLEYIDLLSYFYPALDDDASCESFLVASLTLSQRETHPLIPLIIPVMSIQLF